MAALNNRFRPRFGVCRLREFSLMFGMSPALKIALRLRLESNPPSRLRYELSIFRPVSLATRFRVLNPFWQKYGIGFVDGCDRKRREHEAVVFHDRDDLL